MKKFISLILALVMVFSLAACGSKAPETPAKEYVQELVEIRQQQRLYAQAIDGSEPRLIKDIKCWAYSRSGETLIAQFEDANVYKINLRTNEEEILFN